MSASTSCNERAERLLQQVLAGGSPDLSVARSLAADDCSDGLFRIVVEGLADRFERRLCDAYAALFSEVLASVFPDLTASALLDRYNRIRTPRPCTANPDQVFVLSRVTLGADIAITGVLLQAAKKRFPIATITFVGSAKSAELFPDVDHIAAPYPRTGSLHDRLEASRAIANLVDRPRTIVLDPDSRLTQLGLLPVCAEPNYFFFESRSYLGESNLALSQLASLWCQEVLGVEDFTSLPSTPAARTGITVSFGVGENSAKRVSDDFESSLLAALPSPVLIDRGAGGEEGERVDRAIAKSGTGAQTWTGSFAGFTRRIAQSRLYVGYDSAGQHAAAALGIPLVVVFRGYVSQRMFDRWKPIGNGRIAIVNAENLDAAETLRQTLAAIRRLLSADTSEGANESRE